MKMYYRIYSRLFFLSLCLALVGCSSEEEVDVLETPETPGCTSLFDGASLRGWTQLGNASISIEDGVIVGRGVQEPVNTFLKSDLEYTDFDLTFEFQVDSLVNSGVQIRSAVAEEVMRFDHQAGNGDRFEQVTTPGRVYGVQAEIDGTSRGWTAQLYEGQGRGWLETFSKDVAPLVLDHAKWYTFRILALEDSITTWIDQEIVASMAPGGRNSGFIALEVHAIRQSDDSDSAVRFRNISLCNTVQ